MQTQQVFWFTRTGFGWYAVSVRFEDPGTIETETP